MNWITAISSTTRQTESDFWCDLSRFLELETRSWWGASDVAGGLWSAMQGLGANLAMVSWQQGQGVELTPDVLGGWVETLSQISNEPVTTQQLSTALANALRDSCGLRGGVVLARRGGAKVRISVMAYGNQVRAI